MRTRIVGICAVVAPLVLAGCASPARTTELDHLDQFSGYRYATLDKKAGKTVDKAAIMLTFSGGGTRAAALADGVLHALAETEIKGKDGIVPLASEVDVVSSVSGGSVTAAYFALGGIDGLGDLEKNFLYSDIMSVLIGRTLLDPLQLLYPRIDILDSYLDDNVFHHKTYKDLIDADGPGKNRRPYVVLNAADMASGSVFSFDQDQFDLICADLAALKIADALSASAAFPVALSSLTIKNRAPCDAQRKAASTDGSGWRVNDGWPEPIRIVNDRAADASIGVKYPKAENLARFRRGTVSLTYLNRDQKKDYIQLLDGGIADNLGLTLPLTLLTSPSESPSFLNWVNTGKVDKLLLVVVNARGEADNDFGTQARPAGISDMLMTAIGTPIDATSFQLLGQLDLLIDDRFKPKAVVLVDFDFIVDRGCRAHFHKMATSWTLPREDIDDLIALGKAMVLQSPRYKDFVMALGGTVPTPQPSVDQICAPYRKISQSWQKSRSVAKLIDDWMPVQRLAAASAADGVVQPAVIRRAAAVSAFNDPPRAVSASGLRMRDTDALVPTLVGPGCRIAHTSMIDMGASPPMLARSSRRAFGCRPAMLAFDITGNSTRSSM